MPELRPDRQATRAIVLCALAAALIGPLPARALLSGTPPSYVRNYRLWGSAAVTGNTLMYDDGTVNFTLIPGGTDGIISELPTNAEVEAAFLFWSGSYNPGAPDYIDVDRDVDFSIPAGRTWRNLSVDALEPGEDPASAGFNRCITVDSTPYGEPEYFYACRRDVTALVQQGGSALNGNYHMAGVEAVAGDCNVDPLCQAKYAGWSLIVVWSSPSERVRRDVVLFDGFYLFDEDAGPPFTTGISAYFTLDRFEVGNQPRGFLSFFALEGDEQLGVPPQDMQGCPTCYDFFELYTQQNTTPYKLSDDVNPANNIYNGSRARGGSSPGVDLDTFDISSRLRTGDTYLRFRVGSGDGVSGGDQGGGELVLLSYVIVSLDTFAPNFINAATYKSVAEDSATPGAVLHYTVRVTNDGSAPANQVTVTDAMPRGTTYVASSTSVCGSAVADVAGQSPLVAGVNLGTLYERPPGRQSCEIRFQVRVNSNVAPGTTITNSAVVDSAETEPLTLNASTRIEGLRLAAPTKTALDVNGGDLVPGDVVSYTVTIRNDTDAAVSGLNLTDSVPPELENVVVLAVPSGATNRSAGNQIAVDAIQVSARSSVSVIFNGQVRAGIASGTPIVNQGYLSHPSLPSALATDDPATPTAGDPTIVTVRYAVDLTTSTKAGVDVNGGAAEPGDLLRYTINLTNTGSIAATASLEDALPAGLEACALVYRPPGSTIACYTSGGTAALRGQVVVPANATRQIVFEARITGGIGAGTVIQNRADVTYAEDPNALLQLVSNSFTVVAGPVLTRSSKTVEDLDGAPTRPGDRLRYTIVVTNSGNRPATSVEVRDVVDPNLVDVAPGQGGQYSGSAIVWNSSTTGALASIGAGSSVSLTFEATVRRPLADRTPIRNSAELRSSEITTPVVVTAPVVTVTAQSRLALTKTVADLNAPPYQPRDRVRYTLTLTNSGDAPATQVTIADGIDAALENALPDSGGQVSNGSVLWEPATTPALAQVDPGAIVVLTFEATIRDRVDDGTLVSNQAIGIAAPPQAPLISDDPALPGADDPTVFRIEAPPALTLSKSVVDDNGGQFVPGESVTYTISVGNNGVGPAHDVVVSDAFPAQLERLAATPAPTGQTGNALTWDRTRVPALARIWPGDRVDILVTARIVRPLADGSAVSNQAAAAASGTGSTASDDPATPAVGDPTVFFVRSLPVLSDFQKRVIDVDGDGVFRPGDQVRYTLRVANTGSEQATSIVVTDTVPLQIADVTAARGQVTGNQVQFDATTEPALAQLAVDGLVELTIEGTLRSPLDPGTPVSNQASVSASGIAAELSDDPTTPVRDDPTTFRVTSAPDLSTLSKQVTDVNGGVVAPGDELSYEITVVNRGDADALDVVVSDPIDANLTVLTIGANGRRVGNSLLWDAAAVASFARLAPGSPVALTFSARIATPLDNNTRIANQAQAMARGLARPELSDDPSTAASDDPTVVFVISASDLSTSTKRVLDSGGQPLATARPGQVISYRIELVNTGNAVARDIAVVDPVDANLTVGAVSDGGALSGSSIRWDAVTTPALVALAPGQTAVLTFGATLRLPLDNGLVIANQAQLRPTGVAVPFVSDDPSTGERSDPTRFSVVSNPDLTATSKAAIDINGGEFEPGDHIRYEINVVNSGDALARSVAVDDAIDTRYLRNVTALRGQFDGARVRFDPATEPALAAVGVGSGSAVLLVIEADILFPLDDGTEVLNQAAVTATGLAPVASDDPATAQLDDATRFVVRAIPRLAVRKSLASPSDRVAPPGGDVIYHFEIENPGSASTSAVVLTDIVPPEVIFVSAGLGSYDDTTRTLTVDLGTLAARTPPVAFDLAVRVRDDLESGTVANQARATAGNVSPVLSDDPATPIGNDPTLFDVRAIVDLSSSSKTALDLDGDLLRPGDRIRYTISVVNHGNTSARDVVVSDPLPLGLEIESVEEGGRSDGQTATWDPLSTPALSRVAIGVPVELHLVARVGREVVDGTRLDNQAQLTTGSNSQRFVSDDPATADVAGDPTTVVVQAPRLEVSKTVTDENGGSVRPNDVLAYTIALRNGGSAPLRQAVITDPVPAGSAVEEIESGGQLAAGVVRWDGTTSPGLVQIEAGQTATVQLRLRVDRRAVGGQIVANQAQVESDDLFAPLLSDDPTTAAAADPTAVTVDARVELDQSVKRVASAPDPLRPGDEVAFEIAVHNSGTQYATDVVVTDRIDPEMFDRVAADQNGRFESGSVTWSAPATAALAEIAPGDRVVLGVRCRVAAGVRNNSYVENSGHLAEASGVQFTTPVVRLQVTALPRFATSTKVLDDANGGEVEPGDLLRYRLLVRNDGSDEVAAVKVRDAVPAGTRYLAESTKVNGVPVGDVAGASGLAAGLEIGDLAAGAEIPIEFAVRVLSDVLRGTVIENQGFVSATDLPEVGTDDPATTQVIGDPTRAVVGGGPLLVATLLAAPRQVAAGGEFELALLFQNAARQPAPALHIELPFTTGARFAPGSMALDRVPVSDAPDGDAAVATASGLQLALAELAPGDARSWTMRFVASGGQPTVVFQGALRDGSGQPSVSTDGDPGTPGTQPTVVVVGAARADLSTSSLAGDDVNGGLLLPGDEIRYRIVVANGGTATATLSPAGGVRIPLSPLTTLVDGSIEGTLPLWASVTDGALHLAVGTAIEAGERVSATFRVRVVDQAEAGSTIQASALVQGDGLELVTLGPVQLMVGGMRGSGRLSGRVYEDAGGAAGSFDNGTDVAMAGFQVLVRRATGNEVVASAIAAADGKYEFASVPAGALQLSVLSETGALFEKVKLDDVPADAPTERDVLIDPSGVVYDARTGAGIAGARAYLYLDDGDDDPGNDRLASSDRVAAEQQGQLTNRDGLYKFDVTPGRYRLGLVPASPTQLFPSLLLPPSNDDRSSHPFGSFAVTDEQHRVVASARPDLKGDTHYYLRFDIAVAADEVLHNHLPLDPLSAHVSLVKSASHKRVSVGDIVTYTVRYSNRSPLQLTVADEGGAAVVDAIPDGFKYLKGSTRLEQLVRSADGAQHRRVIAHADPSGDRLLNFGPYDLLPYGEYQLRYQLVVAPNAEFGDHENTAVLRTATSQTDISNASTARVAVVPDPIFDLGTVIGKIYCDDNGNLMQDNGELPLPGATVYLDTGRHAESDVGGKFHFSGLRPGMHLLKLDERTLPPGSRLTTEERVHIYVTRGLPSRIAYGVGCRFDRISGAQLKTAASRPAEDGGIMAARAQVKVTGVLTQRAIALDGAEQATVRVDLGIGIGDQDRDYSSGDGPNHGGLDPAAGFKPALHFYPRVVTALPLMRWRLAITDSAGAEVYAFANDGAPPEDLPWDGRDSANGTLLLAAGKEYRAQLSATATNSDWGASAPRVFGTGVGSATAFVVGYESTIDEVAGALFDKRNKPTPRLRAFVKQAARELAARPDERVTVAAHTDDQVGAAKGADGLPPVDAGAASVTLTTARAESVRGELIKAGIAAERIAVTGEGDQNPLVPNLGKRNRSRNRRVEVRTTSAALRGPPLPHLEYPGRVSVNGSEVTELAPSTAFAQIVEVAVGDTLAIDLTAPSGGRVVLSRVYTGEPFPVGAPPPPGSVGIAIRGDVGARSVQFADEARSLALLDTRIDLEGGEVAPALTLTKSGLDRELVFVPAIADSAAITHWRLIVFTPPAAAPTPAARVPEGGGSDALPELAPLVPAASAPALTGAALVDPYAALVSDQAIGPPATPVGAVIKEFSGEGAPAPVRWRGQSDGGDVLLRPGWYGYRLEVETADGGRAYSPPGYFSVNGDAVVERLTLNDPFAGGKTKLALRDVTALRALASRHPGAAVAYRVVAHTDDQVPRDQAAGLTRDWAEQTKRALVAAKVSADVIDVVGMGNSDPQVPNVNRKNRARNRRVVVEVLGAAASSAAGPPTQKPTAIYVEANGLAVPAPLGVFAATSFVARQGLLQLRVVLPSGAEAIWLYRPDLPEVLTGAEAAESIPAAAPASDELAAPLVAAPGGEDFMPFEPSSAPLVLVPGEDGGVTTLTATPVADSTSVAHLDSVDGGYAGVDAAGIQAAVLSVDLPAAGAIVRANRLPVRGVTAAGNKVTVNGKPVNVDPESGSFVAIVDLPEGRSVLRIEATDQAGNVAAIERGVEVDSSGLFALVLADTSLADRNANLPEWNGYNHLKLGGVALYGRGAALLKGRWTSDSFFKRYDFTLHVDTARWNEDSFEQELLDPERYYPTYADSSLEVIDAEARYPLYAELRADDSFVRIGNFRTRFEGGDLFRYDRARYGLVLKFDRSLGQLEGGTTVLDNDVNFFVAGGDAPRRHARVELRGTGGSLYYLAHDTVVEGSERIAVLVRDGITGSELYRRPLGRNVDYTIRYREGRLVLTAPLSSTAESGWIGNQNLSTVYAGHPVYLEVEYEHEGESDYNELGAGLAVSETVLEHVTVGGGYVYEGRADERPAFQLAGAHLKLAYDARTFIQGEWAYSQSIAMDNYVSDDGGLSFMRNGQQVDDGPVLLGRALFPAERAGHAFKLRGQTSLGGLWGGNPDDLALRAHFQRLAPGFSTGISAIEAGQTKYGLEGRWLITPRDRVELRYDGIWSDIPQVPQLTEFRTLHRELATLQYQRRQDTLTLTGEYAFAYTWDSGAFGQNAFAEERTVLGNVAAGGVEWEVLPRLTLLARQEGIITGDERMLPTWADHLVTTAGARYKLTDDLQLSLTESLRWSGENATVLGLQSRLNESADVYARERFNMRGNAWLASTVVGANGALTDSTRAYTEYQLDGAMSGNQTRAVMGLGTTWKIISGLTLHLGYERTQVFGGTGLAPATGTLPPALTDSYAFAATGANGGSMFYLGRGSRDAASAGLDLTLFKTLKAGFKLELRYDDLDEKRGGQDRIGFLTQGTLAWQWTQDFALLARFNWADVENRTLQLSEAGLQDLSLGIAYRPVSHEWLSILSKYGRRLEHRPLSLSSGSFEEYSADVLSLEPIFELPWGLQLVEKVALKYARERVDDLPVGNSLTLLWINRLNVHVLRLLRPVTTAIPGDIDLGAEWRVLTNFFLHSTEQGLLLEAAYAPVEYLRFGVGWNFTRFSDDEYARNNEDASGFFFRVIGQY